MRAPVAVVAGFLSGIIAMQAWHMASSYTALPGVDDVHECSHQETLAVYATVDDAYASRRSEVRVEHRGATGTFVVRAEVADDDSVAATEVSGTLKHGADNVWTPAKCATPRRRCARGLPWETELFHTALCP